MKIKRTPRKLNIGSYYIVWFDYREKFKCKFIQPTLHGFNFLDIETNKCILKHHVYPSKLKTHATGNWFWLNADLNIQNADLKFN